MSLYPTIDNYIAQLESENIPEDRRMTLEPLVEYLQNKVTAGKSIKLNFICTHNSRRSQLAQVWAAVAACYHGVAVDTYSGGVEATAFNERAVQAMERAGFRIATPWRDKDNPVYDIRFSDEQEPITAFSKLYDDPENPTEGFAAVMTCSHADENCPFIPGAEKRIPVTYVDPKEFDETPEEAARYDERSAQIAREMMYVFSRIQRP